MGFGATKCLVIYYGIKKCATTQVTVPTHSFVLRSDISGFSCILMELIKVSRAPEGELNTKNSGPKVDWETKIIQ